MLEGSISVKEGMWKMKDQYKTYLKSLEEAACEKTKESYSSVYFCCRGANAFHTTAHGKTGAYMFAAAG